MTLFYGVLLLLTVAATSPVQRGSQRAKRGLLELMEAIECSTGRIALSYIGYGCYCGLGGRGSPKDATDLCCHKHDCCYDYAEKQGCHPKTDQYAWECKDRTFECEDLEDECEKLICKCDKDFSECLGQSYFDWRFAFWPNFRCGQDEPMCSIYS